MKRKDFIVKGSMASLGLYSISMLGGSQSVLGANDKVKLGIIGTGSRGNGLIPIINKVKGIDLIACCDNNKAHLDEGLKRVDGKPQSYLDYRELLDNKEVDGVIVAVPFGLHAEIELEAMKAGKHIYGEKTMAKGYRDIKRLVDTKPDNIVFQTGHQYRNSKVYAHVVDLIREGKIGEVSYFEGQYNKFDDWRRPVSQSETDEQINWRMYRKHSGGPVAELSSHEIDFVNWALDETPEQVMGTGGIDYWKDGRETYDNIHLIYNYPNGAKARFTSVLDNSNGGYHIKVMGSKGTIILDQNNAWFYPEGGRKEKQHADIDGVSGATVQIEEEGELIDVSMERSISEQAMIDFRDNILNNKTPNSNIMTGAKTSVCVQMSLDAMYNNEIVKWDDIGLNF